jgi:hypothetical protein
MAASDTSFRTFFFDETGDTTATSPENDVQDMGDGLHTTVGLDSGFVFDTNANDSNPANKPERWLAEGRDPSATTDSAFGGFGKNEGDATYEVVLTR